MRLWRRAFTSQAMWKIALDSISDSSRADGGAAWLPTFSRTHVMNLLASAKALAERVEAESAKAQTPVAVCVIDVHGNLVLQERMNGAPLFSLVLSRRKAYTSALVGVRTAELVPQVQPGAPLFALLSVAGGALPPWVEAYPSRMGSN
ncbi:GlcG/HbpS family heme-binding protein [Frateuria edaphi]|uniref:GlcG/HbpS family heme-binding protein n=1 Tax=Frateuria edaphi TaxID=2898793 RepID=UPI003CE5BC7E